jgi:putative ABC transport system permease protein
MSSLKVAWRNLGRNAKRTLLAVMAVAVGQLALLLMLALMHGYSDNLRKAVTGPLIGHLQVHHPEWREERALDLTIVNADSLADSIRQHADVQAVAARVYAPVLAAPRQDAHAAMVLGVDIARESEPFGMLSSLESPLKPQHVLVGYRLARRLEIQDGQEIALLGQAPDGSMANDLYTVQAVIRCPVDLVNQSGIVMSLADARTFLYLADEAHELVVRTRTGGLAAPLADSLRAAHPEFEILTWSELVPDLAMMVNMSDVVGYFVVVLVMIAAVAGIANTLMMSIFERSHELGMLLALGAAPRRLVGMVMTEAMLIGVIGTTLGTIGGIVCVALTNINGIDFASWGGEDVRDAAFQGLSLPLHIFPRLAPIDILIGLIAISATALVASLWPAWITSRLEPISAMRT